MRVETDSTGAEEEGPRQRLCAHADPPLGRTDPATSEEVKTPARLNCRGLTRDPCALFYAGLKLSTPHLVAHHGRGGLEMAVLF